MIKFSMKKVALISGLCLSANSFAGLITDTVEQKNKGAEWKKSSSHSHKLNNNGKKQVVKLKHFNLDKDGILSGKLKRKGHVKDFLASNPKTYQPKRPHYQPKRPHPGKPVVTRPTTTVPEPATLGLIGLGLAGLGLSRRYNKS